MGRIRLAVLVLLACGLGCNAIELADAGADAAFDATTTDATFAWADGSYEDVLPQYQPPDAVAPPNVDCVDGGDAGLLCPLPPSICLDGLTLEYFDNGVCVDGGCHFDVLEHTCGNLYYCADGGCQGGGITAPTQAP